MPERIPQSATIRIPLYLVLSSDHISPATGKTLAITISKNGAAFGNPSGGATNATEIASGWYYYDASTTDTGTTGPLVVLGTATSCDACTIAYNVVAATNGGLTALPDTAVTTNASLITSGTGTAQLKVTSGCAGLDWATINAPTTSQGLTGTTIATSQVVASVSGAVGSVTGAVGSVAGAVGSVTGNVGGNVVGSVASVTARVTANTDQLAGQTVTAAAGVTFPTSVASPTNITAGTITTVTNLTNAATSGDLTATMKTSVTTAATAATPTAAAVTGNVGGNVTGSVGSVVGAVGSVTGAVGSVTGNVGGNVVGSVASVTARVTANTDQWAGGTIPAPNVTGVPLVDIKYTLGTLSAGAAGYMGIDWSAIDNPTATVALTNTTINSTSGTVSANVTQILGVASAGAPGYMGIDWAHILHQSQYPRTP